MRIPEDMLPGNTLPTKINGNVLILKYNGCFNVTIQFLDTGTILDGVRSDLLRKGTVKDLYRPTVHGIGYFGGR